MYVWNTRFACVYEWASVCVGQCLFITLWFCNKLLLLLIQRTEVVAYNFRVFILLYYTYTHTHKKTIKHAYIHTHAYIPTRFYSCRRRRRRRRRQQRRLNCMRIFFISLRVFVLHFVLWSSARSVDLIYWQHCCCCACWKWKCVSMYVCMYVLQIASPAKQKQNTNKQTKLTNKISQQFFLWDLRDFIFCCLIRWILLETESLVVLFCNSYNIKKVIIVENMPIYSSI